MIVQGGGKYIELRLLKSKKSDSDSEGAGVFAASVGSGSTSQMGKWLVDSGASIAIYDTREGAANGLPRV